MLNQNYQQVKDAIVRACQAAHRGANTVTLLAVSKRHNVEKIRAIYALGQRDFGENYLNEALEKQAELSDLSIAWHFIGHIQSNKTRKVAEHFDWVHAVDSFKVAKRLSEQRPKHLSSLNVCLQINIDDEDSKAGLTPNKTAVLALAKKVADLPNINLRGLMCIPAPKDSKDEAHQTFMRMADLQTYVNDNGLSLDTLSMGMSNDLDTAIDCGATIVRVGTAIFGARN